jgi:hypothetical protein
MHERKKIPMVPVAERLWRRVEKLATGCWEFTGSKNRKGYGTLGNNNTTAMAHRVSWQSVNGDIPVGMLVLHRCDNPPCVNPDHLFLGTNQDNMDDMTAKGRRVIGERSPRSKLTAAKVIEIRRRRDAGERTEDLAAEFGVSSAGLYSAAVGLTWRHLQMPLRQPDPLDIE